MKILLFIIIIFVVMCSCSKNSTEPKYESPTEGLIAYYPFNMNIVDESENELDGSENNGTIPINDRFNNPNSAFYFDGNDDYIILQNIENYFPEGVTEYSFSVWFLPATEDFNVILCDTEDISYWFMTT